MNLQTVTRDLGWHFETSQQIFINIANKKPRGQPSDVIVSAVPLSGKKNYVQSASWSLAEFRHNKIVQSPHENYFKVCRQHKEK